MVEARRKREIDGRHSACANSAVNTVTPSDARRARSSSVPTHRLMTRLSRRATLQYLQGNSWQIMTMRNKLNIHHESQSPLMGLVVSVVERKNKTVYLSILTKSGEIISGKFKEDVKMS